MTEYERGRRDGASECAHIAATQRIGRADIYTEKIRPFAEHVERDTCDSIVALKVEGETNWSRKQREKEVTNK